MNLSPGRPLERHEIADLLTEARTRTLLLVNHGFSLFGYAFVVYSVAAYR